MSTASVPTVSSSPLPSLSVQAERLIELGVHDLAGLSAAQLRRVGDSGAGGLLVVNPRRVPVSSLAALLRHADKEGFVVTDMADVDRFAAIDQIDVPGDDVYLVIDPTRGDEMSNWSPDEALPAILHARRTPLTLAEGVHWLLQQPRVLERNHCFMTIGSRLHKDNGRLDARTPAVWISNGIGRDGAARRHAPKIGWCWAGNRHTWLGFASAEKRETLSI